MVTSTWACVCALASGWFGVHDTWMGLPVGTTVAPPATLTDGASGGVIVVISPDSVHADARFPRTARTRYLAVPPPGLC